MSAGGPNRIDRTQRAAPAEQLSTSADPSDRRGRGILSRGPGHPGRRDHRTSAAARRGLPAWPGSARTRPSARDSTVCWPPPWTQRRLTERAPKTVCRWTARVSMPERSARAARSLAAVSSAHQLREMGVQHVEFATTLLHGASWCQVTPEMGYASSEVMRLPSRWVGRRLNAAARPPEMTAVSTPHLDDELSRGG